eukprot:TRINITY_DN48404_c0_g1_i1.p2 TRINITY_DN48404_c0_g1~~TRINITY_DN48404_c0_g1_i1.p2  ORF type:complete len:156 (-),score=5.02 TRINITY_DN48404_c0_g1_i1:483-896(-)
MRDFLQKILGGNCKILKYNHGKPQTIYLASVLLKKSKVFNFSSFNNNCIEVFDRLQLACVGLNSSILGLSDYSFVACCYLQFSAALDFYDFQPVSTTRHGVYRYKQFQTLNHPEHFSSVVRSLLSNLKSYKCVIYDD